MADRLSALDVSFLYLEEPTTPMHVGGAAVFEPPPGGFDHDRLVDLIERRIALVPRYRQKVRWVPGHIGYPVWVDDGDFDIGYHVRRSALPRPGSDEQLRELVARLMSRRLDRNRPLWEIYLVEGLRDGRVAVITKSHHAMVDGISAIDIGQVILDLTAEPRPVPEDVWMPEPEPNPIELVLDAVADIVRRPSAVADAVRLGVNDAKTTVSTVAGQLGGLLAAARTAARPAPDSPLNAEIGEQRRFGTARTRVSSYLVDLPVGEPNPVMRLHQVSFAMKAHKEAGQSVGADTLVRLSGFAPPTLHSMGARAASSLSRRLFNTVVTNVPGPQFPLYADGAKMLEVFPVVPLAKGQAVSIGLTSYNGGVYYGLNADREAMSDVDLLSRLIEESLEELVETVR
jgi:hypothetical protein